MIKISWVKIPSGEYPIGLSQEQVETFRTKARAEAGYSRSSPEEQQQFEDYTADRRERWRLFRLGEATELFTTLPPEIVRLEKKYRGVDKLLNVERALAGYINSTVQVKMKTYYISRFPVTVEQCEAFFNRFDDEKLRKRRGTYLGLENHNHPEAVEWHIADLFCQWVGGRLPTSIEWECAARGSEGFLYPWGNEWNSSYLNLNRVSTPVKAYPEGVSPFGVWDMIGNQAEWTMDLMPHYEGGMEAKFMGEIAKDKEPPDWFYYNASLGAPRPIDAPPYYVGFRPILDSWRKRIWTGFQSES